MESRKLTQSRMAPWNWFRHEQPGSERNDLVAGDANPVTRMHQEMDRLFDDVFRSFGFPESRRSGMPGVGESDFLYPSIDIRAHEDRYEISVEVPGVEEKDLNLSVENDSLVIRGEKRSEVRDENADEWHRIERRYGQFQRVLALPADADENDIRARFNNGVLTIDLPRKNAENGGSRTIQIEH